MTYLWCVVLGVQEVASSSLVTPTMKNRNLDSKSALRFFLWEMNVLRFIHEIN